MNDLDYDRELAHHLVHDHLMPHVFEILAPVEYLSAPFNLLVEVQHEITAALDAMGRTMELERDGRIPDSRDN